ncbi:uncharacterized protein LOC113229228 [Hyposmocoma kahamanoa]|uniref:uncharacterized protein LOC113229228 n=1 Tax=Hyposmocoma kahamanoa TaxID=1477025 RepID=UPI000E6D8323|nr:uncharacterized protein LOC113229228 [Hyposmocoma kahamanoa]
MPKRKRSRKYEEDLDYLMHKVRKLQRKIRDESESDSARSSPTQEDVIPTPYNEIETAVPVLQPSDWLSEVLDDEPVDVPHKDQQTLTSTMTNTSNSNDVLPQEGANTSAVDTEEKKSTEEEPATLDTDILQILGDDPSSTVKYGKDIRKEIATRFQHGATEGITKEIRKELISKYPIPANCLHMDAPKLNLEIKAAVPETIAKRDKGIEAKQKQMATALSCLGEILTMHLNSINKDNDLLQKLIDISRILCDIQHADSVTRRNFILFSLKNDLKEHLVNTKVDNFLFGENLAETLKTAKARGL